MHVAYEQGIADLCLTQFTTDDWKAAALAVLQACAALDDTAYSGTTTLDAYNFVQSRFEALDLPDWFIRKYKTLANSRVQFHSR